MIFRIDPNGSISLDDPDTFNAFHVRAPGFTSERIVSTLENETATAKEGHIWISIQCLHALGQTHGGPDWREGCDGMIAYARTQGWVDDERNFVLAHLELDD